MKEQKVNVSSPELLQFYKAWDAWADEAVETGQAPDHMSFDTWQGLCGCLDDYAVFHGMSARQLGMELAKQFVDAGLDPNYPFGAFAYGDAEYYCTMHKDEKRLNWVRTRIKEYVDAN